MREHAATLTGFAVAVTASAHRDRELATFLLGRGAAVVRTPLLRTVPVAADPALRQLTQLCIEEPPDLLAITSAGGCRRWLDAADGWKMRRALVAALGNAIVVARGERAAQAARDCGLSVTQVAASETLAELLALLLPLDLAGRRVVLQEHGGALDHVVANLSAVRADVIRVDSERWVPYANPSPVHQLSTTIIRREVHAVTFATAAALSTLLDTTARAGRLHGLLAALATDVAVVCTHPTAGVPLAAHGLAAMCPPEPTPSAIGDLLGNLLARRDSRRVVADGRHLVLQGHAVFADGSLILLAPDLAALFHALAARSGESMLRAELASTAWPYNGVNRRTVDRRVDRLRAALGPLSWLVETVPHGYRLAATVATPVS